MSILPYDEKNPTLHYMLQEEAARLEAERRANEARTAIRYSFPQSSEPQSSLIEKIERLREEYLPDLFQIQNRDRLWVILKGCTIGMIVFAISSYVIQLPTTN